MNIQENKLCPECIALRKEIKRLRAIAEEAATVSELIQTHGKLTEEVQNALHALDFELLEDSTYDWPD